MLTPTQHEATPPGLGKVVDLDTPADKADPEWQDAQPRSPSPLPKEPELSEPSEGLTQIPADAVEPNDGQEAKGDEQKTGDGDEEEEYEDEQAKPPPKQLSKAAIQKRLYRIMQPKSDGTFKVPQEVLDNYRDPEKRDDVINLFEKSGYEPAGICVCLFLLDS